MKKIIVAVISSLCLILPLSGAWADQLDASQAVNVAGSQRMLSQRIVKAYCQMGLNAFYGDPDVQIKDGVALFERNLTNLAPYIKEGDAALAAEEVRQHWIQYKALATSAPTKENARKLYEISEQLLTASQSMVSAIQSSTGVKT